jgi:hypothetical protein
MPFDGTGFPKPPRPKRPAMGDDTAASIVIVAIAFCLLVAPFSLNALVDIVRYLRG